MPTCSMPVISTMSPASACSGLFALKAVEHQDLADLSLCPGLSSPYITTTSCPGLDAGPA
jgi:hypothetical protein